MKRPAGPQTGLCEYRSCPRWPALSYKASVPQTSQIAGGTH